MTSRTKGSKSLVEAAYDNGYSLPWNYATTWFLRVKARTGFRKKTKQERFL